MDSHLCRAVKSIRAVSNFPNCLKMSLDIRKRTLSNKSRHFRPIKVILDILLRNNISNVSVVQLPSVLEYFDKDRFMSDIIDAYYSNNDEKLSANFINTQSLGRINIYAGNDIYAGILFEYFKHSIKWV